MKQRQLFEKLRNEQVIHIPYEASISIQLDCIIGDVPVYKFVVQYFTSDKPGVTTEELKTYDELLRLFNIEEAFRTCDECGDLITDGFIANHELKKDYCCVACMTKAMNRRYGKGNWRFKAAESIIDEEDETIETNEYQYEIISNRVRLEVFKHMLEEQGKQFELLEIEPGSEEAMELGDSRDSMIINLEEATWVPYHMYYCPPLYEEDESGDFFGDLEKEDTEQ